jgi:hypothetical protein
VAGHEIGVESGGGTSARYGRCSTAAGGRRCRGTTGTGGNIACEGVGVGRNGVTADRAELGRGGGGEMRQACVEGVIENARLPDRRAVTGAVGLGAEGEVEEVGCGYCARGFDVQLEVVRGGARVDGLAGKEGAREGGDCCSEVGGKEGDGRMRVVRGWLLARIVGKC